MLGSVGRGGLESVKWVRCAMVVHRCREVCGVLSEVWGGVCEVVVPVWVVMVGWRLGGVGVWKRGRRQRGCMVGEWVT